MTGCWRHVLLLILLATVAFAGGTQAVEPSEKLSDAGLEARARHISADLRCLVCQNQSIDDSDAELAADLRLLVRERLEAGDSDDQVEGFLVQRYGDYILLKPPLVARTYVLWLGPLIILIVATLFAVRFYRRHKSAHDPVSP